MWSFLNTLKSEILLRFNGSTFHSVGAEAIKPLSPKVGHVSKIAKHKRSLLFDVKLSEEFVLKFMSSVI